MTSFISDGNIFAETSSFTLPISVLEYGLIWCWYFAILIIAHVAMIYRYFVTISYFRINKHCVMMISIDFRPILQLKIAVVLARPLPKTCHEIICSWRFVSRWSDSILACELAIVVLNKILAYTTCVKWNHVQWRHFLIHSDRICPSVIS
jgi:hypothetical protein